MHCTLCDASWMHELPSPGKKNLRLSTMPWRRTTQWSKTPRLLNFLCRRSWAVSFTLRLLYPVERAPGTQRVDPRAVIIFGEEYKWRSSSSCNFLHLPVIFRPFGPNIFASLSMWSFLAARDQAYTHTKQKLKLHFCTFWSLRFRIEDGKTKDSEVNGRKQPVIHLLLSLLNTGTLPHIPRMYLITKQNGWNIWNEG
jgi:hypothetical protein